MPLYITSSDGQHREIAFQKDDTVANAVWLSGITTPLPLCSGLGTCGKCRVRFLDSPPPPLTEETEILGVAAVDVGWRLGCRHTAHDGMKIELGETFTERLTPQPSNPRGIFLAVDLGTTSIQWSVLDEHGARVDAGHAVNPQMGAGSDVVSRIQAARTPAGRQRLRDSVICLLKSIVERFVGIRRICVAGNTAMTTILCGDDVEGLAAAPYRVPFKGGCEVALPSLPPLWIPPQIAPFVGGDISSGIAALFAENVGFPFLFADLGTNGEFVLCADKNHAVTVGVPLGPAIEGIGMRCGTLAEKGSIVSFLLDVSGIKPRFWNDIVPEDGLAKGISGTGYISLVALLRRVGVLDADGILNKNPVHPLAARLLRTVSFTPRGWIMHLGYGVSIEAADIEELLKVRAGFALAVNRLMAFAKIPAHKLSWLIAGVLGQHVDPTDLGVLGFIPSGTESMIHRVGNTSLRGAELFLTQPQWRERIAAWTESCRTLDLTGECGFAESFAGYMRFGV